VCKNELNQIASGEQTEATQIMSKYWLDKLIDRNGWARHKEVCFTNGTQKDAPKVTVALKRIRMDTPKRVMIIELGKILSN